MEIVGDSMFIVGMINIDGDVKKAMESTVFINKAYVPDTHFILICRLGTL